jgi:hypothetical protein
VFEQFSQVGDNLTDTPRGTGLGLPICREIVEHHGGRLWLESEVGRGTRFSFTLPIADASAADPSPMLGEPIAAAPRSASPGDETREGPAGHEGSPAGTSAGRSAGG